MTPNIPIIAWAPDADPATPGVLVDVENLLPTARGYAPEFSLTVSSWGLTTYLPAGDVCGAALVAFQYFSQMSIIATPTDIYAVSPPDQFTSIKRASPDYVSVLPTNPWRFDSFGDKLLAANFENPLQVSSSVPTSALRDVSGGPRASTIATQRGFVLLGNYVPSGGTTLPDGWICSALEDPEDWTTDIATQCAAGRLTATPGRIVRLIAFGDYVIAFKEKGVYRGTYVGAADNTWSWPLVSAEIGLYSHDAVCEAEGVLYWLGKDGFYRWDGAGPVQRIASAPFEWMIDEADGIYGISQAQASWDAVRRVVRWVIPLTGATAPRLCLVYHPDTDRWGRSALPVQWMLAVPLDLMPTVAGSSTYLRHGVTAYINDSRQLVIHQGGNSLSTYASTFTTGDIGDDDDAYTLTRARARFLRAPTTSSVTHSYRMNLGDALTTGETVSRVDGKYDVTHGARWHRLKFSQTGVYEVTGYRVEPPKAGKR